MMVVTNKLDIFRVVALGAYVGVEMCPATVEDSVRCMKAVAH